jgi:hypothetical protein
MKNFSFGFTVSSVLFGSISFQRGNQQFSEVTLQASAPNKCRGRRFEKDIKLVVPVKLD